MKIRENDVVSIIARLSPWLAPIPSAFFVTRSCIIHLNIPIAIGIIIGLIIESLGITSINTWMRLQEWNITKRKSDPSAPSNISLLLVIGYFSSVILLTIVLEIYPALAIYSPALFPLLAVIGAVNLNLISFQNYRETTVRIERDERRNIRSGKNIVVSSLDIANAAKEEKQKSFLQQVTDELNSGNTSPSSLAKKFGKSRTTIYSYISKIQNNGGGHRELFE